MAIGIVLAVIGFISFLDPVISVLTLTLIVGILLIVRGVANIVQAIFAGKFLR